MFNSQNLTLTPNKLFLAMLAIIAIQVGLVQGETYWTFYPNPPQCYTQLPGVMNQSWCLPMTPRSWEGSQD